MKIKGCQGKYVTEIGVKEFTFPDGQPHVKLGCGSHPGDVTITAPIRNGTDLLSVLLVEETLRHEGARFVSLFITYLLGARMDRRIGPGEPFTLKVVAGLLKDQFDKIHVLDPHSDVACALLDADSVSPIEFIRKAVIHDGDMEWYPSENVAFCAPDAGAAKKVEGYAAELGGFKVVQCLKHRDMMTGKLSGFKLASDENVPERVLIVDDICDGGGTFVGVAELLRAHGAKWVGLYVTHGIFSKGFDLKGIDRIFTTTSYRDTYPDNITIVGRP